MTFIITLILGLTLIPKQIVSASSDIDWSWANPYPIGSSLYSITHSNGVYVAVGADGVILTSEDKETWDIQASGTSANLYSVAYVGGKFWCVGVGVVLNSTDGVNWNNPNTGTAFSGRSIGYSGSRYIATSSSSIWYSDDDGATWTLLNLGSVFGWGYTMLYDIIWDGSQFIVVGDSGTVVTSPDGINWTEQTSTVTTRLRSIVCNGSMFVATGSEGTIVSSPNGVDWTQQDSGTGSSLQDITWDGSQFIAVGYPSYAGENICVVTSPDGTTWTKRNASFRASLSGITWNGSDSLVAVGSNGSIATSSDGITWTKISYGTTQTLNDAVWSGSEYVAVGTYGAIVTSTDGNNWMDHSLTMANIGSLTLIPDLKAVTQGNGKFVAVGNWIIVTSLDGISWTCSRASAAVNFRDVIWAGSPLNLYIAAGPGNQISTSPDGITWTDRSLGLPSTNQRVDCLAWNGSTLVAAGSGLSISDRFVATSGDAINWSVNSSFTSGLSDIIWDGSRFIAVESGITIYTSPDGDIWTKTPSSPTSALLNSLIWDGSQYTAVGRAIVHSSDGNTWSEQSMPTGSDLYCIVWNGHNQYITVGQHGTILVAGDPYIPPPVLVSTGTNETGTVISMSFDKAMADPSGKHGQFFYRIDGGDARKFSDAALDHDNTRINLTIDGTAVAYGDLVTVSYTAGDVEAADGTLLDSFTDQPVSNNLYSTEADILSYSLPEQTGPAVIGEGTIDIEVAYGTGVTDLTATFTTSAGVSMVKVGAVSQTSGITANDFTSPVTYAVTAEDGITKKNWVVTVTVARNNEADILSYNFPEQTGPAIIGNGTIDIEVSYGTDVTDLTATFTTSAGVSMVEVSAVSQTSGITANDFTSPVTYTVTAEDGITTKNWVVTATINFPQITHGLTMAMNGNGTISPSTGTHIYDEGIVVDITAIPDSGWQFDSWTGDVADPNSVSTTVTVDGDKTVTAVFIEENQDGEAGGCSCGSANVGASASELALGWGIIGMCWGGGYYMVRRSRRRKI